MKVVTAEEMQEIDRRTIEEYGIPGEVLMALAGRAVFNEVRNLFNNLSRVAVFSGCGNNGGDGFVIAYLLLNHGIDAAVYLTGKKEKISKTAQIYYDLCIKSGIEIIEVDQKILNTIIFDKYDCIIDAMIGTGFNGAVRGIIKDAIDIVNDASIKVVSIDIPSGLPSNGCGPEGSVIYASHTVTIGLPKISLVTYPGKEYTGNLKVVDIDFPKSLTESDELAIDLIDENYYNEKYPVDSRTDKHKSDNGHLVLIGGFDGMEGAILMTAGAAMQQGVGYCTCITTERARDIIAGKIPEMITIGLPDNAGDDSSALEVSLRDIFGSRRYDVLVLGPGIGRDKFAETVCRTIFKYGDQMGIKRVLVDGDGLYHLADYLKEKESLSGSEYILTPHFKEAARILDTDVSTIMQNRLKAAGECVEKSGAVTLLKGPATIISGSNCSAVNSTGNPALATAGTGDCLAGIIGALLLKEIPSFVAASLGAYIHGRAADDAVSIRGKEVIKATDILDYI